MHLLVGAALNFVRVAAWLAETPRARDSPRRLRHSPLLRPNGSLLKHGFASDISTMGSTSPVLLQDPEFRARHEQFQTQIALAIELVEEAIRSKVPFGVVVFDAWDPAEDVVQVLAHRLSPAIRLWTAGGVRGPPAASDSM